MKLNIDIIKGIIFDYGGTLDTGGDHWSHVIRAAYDKAGIAVDEAAFREAYVEVERELARTRHILPHHDFHDLLKIKMRLELQWLSMHGHFPAASVEAKSIETARYCYEAAREKVDEARPVLAALSKKYPLVMVSNFYGNLATVLKDFGIDIYFSHIIESATEGVRKPDPEIFRRGVKALNLPAEEVLVVGDSYSKDILPAEEIGCQTLWIKGRGWTDSEAEIGNENIISEISEVGDLLAAGD